MNKSKFSASLRRLAVVATLGGLSLVPVAAQACAYEPTVSAVCIMAMTRADNFNGSYVVARGQLMQVNQYAALYSLIGWAYGGNGSSNFNLPNLQGRMVVGAIQNSSVYGVGKTGGAETATLTFANLPTHTHPITHNLTATTTLPTFGAALTSLTATANLANIPFSSSSSTLRQNAVTGGARVADPTSAYLTTTTTSGAVYTTAGTPVVAMNTGAISGGVSGTLSGTAPVTTTASTVTVAPQGPATTTLSGAIVAGNAGQSTAFAIMPPFVAMNYFIAVNGMYPNFD